MEGETSIYLDPPLQGVLGTRNSEREVVLCFWTVAKARGDTATFIGQLPESSAGLALSFPEKADDLRCLQLTPVSRFDPICVL